MEGGWRRARGVGGRQIVGLFKCRTKFKTPQLYSSMVDRRGQPKEEECRGPEKGAWLPAPHFPAHFPGRWRTEEAFCPHTDTCWSTGWGGAKFNQFKNLKQTHF